MIWKCPQDDMPHYTVDMDRKTNEQMFLVILPNTCGYRKAEYLSSKEKTNKECSFLMISECVVHLCQMLKVNPTKSLAFL